MACNLEDASPATVRTEADVLRGQETTDERKGEKEKKAGEVGKEEGKKAREM